jgi:hypothetical protein
VGGGGVYSEAKSARRFSLSTGKTADQERRRNRDHAMDVKLIRELERVLGREGVLSRPEDLQLYEYDGSVEEGRPECIVFPAWKGSRGGDREAGEAF